MPASKKLIKMWNTEYYFVFFCLFSRTLILKKTKPTKQTHPKPVFLFCRVVPVLWSGSILLRYWCTLILFVLISWFNCPCYRKSLCFENCMTVNRRMASVCTGVGVEGTQSLNTCSCWVVLSGLSAVYLVTLHSFNRGVLFWWCSSQGTWILYFYSILSKILRRLRGDLSTL